MVETTTTSSPHISLWGSVMGLCGRSLLGSVRSPSSSSLLLSLRPHLPSPSSRLASPPPPRFPLPRPASLSPRLPNSSSALRSPFAPPLPPIFTSSPPSFVRKTQLTNQVGPTILAILFCVLIELRSDRRNPARKAELDRELEQRRAQFRHRMAQLSTNGVTRVETKSSDTPPSYGASWEDAKLECGVEAPAPTYQPSTVYAAPARANDGREEDTGTIAAPPAATTVVVAAAPLTAPSSLAPAA